MPEHRPGPLRRTARDRLATASTEISNIVELGGNLKDSAAVIGAGEVVVVHIQDVGCASVVTNAGVGGFTEGAEAGDVVGRVEHRNVGHEQRRTEDGDLGVEVVVGKVELVSRLLGGKRSSTVYGTGERLVGRVKRRFPHVGELIDPPRVSSLVGHVVEKEDNACVVDDHFGESGPGRIIHRDVWWRVDIIENASLIDIWHV